MSLPIPHSTHTTRTPPSSPRALPARRSTYTLLASRADARRRCRW
jgi:hypothetical protein